MDRSSVIREKRGLAERTRGVAGALSSAGDRANLLRFVQEMDDVAAQLEQEAGDGLSRARNDGPER